MRTALRLAGSLDTTSRHGGLFRGIIPETLLYRTLQCSPSYRQKAEAAWLIRWSHEVELLGLTVMAEPTSSNSKSSASEPYWITPVKNPFQRQRTSTADTSPELKTLWRG
jgi:hypothetical protein